MKIRPSLERDSRLFFKAEDINILRDKCEELSQQSTVTALALRVNALSMIQMAGSGHPGTSLSVSDILVSIADWLKTNGKEFGDPLSDAFFFSSKGHDAPFLYALYVWLGILQQDSLYTLRRLNGLPGHPDRLTNGVIVNTGSLGMGISKAKGLTIARRLRGLEDPIGFVVLGDGELQEGQIWESMLGAAHACMTKLVAIVDSNEVQSDGFVHDTLPLGELRGRARGAGWRYWEVDGNSCKALRRLFDILATEPGPHFVVAKTKKGAGVSFMAPSDSNTNFYSFHSGKLPENLYTEAIDELLRRIDLKLNPNDEIEGLSQTVIDHSKPKFRTANFVDQWRDLLLDLGSELGNVVVLDADLKLDTGTYGFARAFPERYLQMGIAEQDMVSVAGALAVAGYRPYVHSFASFLMRATEQISNNSTERTPVVYVGALAGVLPAAPGHSHQSLSDVGIMGSMPNMEIFEPACPTELAAVSKVIALSERPCYLRLANWEPLAEFSGETIERGSGVLRVGDGRKIFICSSAPLAQQAMMAVSTLAAEGMAWSVMTYPWLTEAISDETAQMLRKAKHVILIENHYPAMALSRRLEDAGVRGVKRLGPVGIPPCGMPEEVLQELGLSATTLAQIARELDA